MEKFVDSATTAATTAKQLSEQLADLANQATQLAVPLAKTGSGDNEFMFLFTIFVMACFVGYYVVWSVTPALHSPLMAVTNAISSVIIVGALLAAGADGFGLPEVMGFFAAILASVNIFGGFLVTHRMLSMFKKKAK